MWWVLTALRLSMESKAFISTHISNWVAASFHSMYHWIVELKLLTHPSRSLGDKDKKSNSGGLQKGSWAWQSGNNCKRLCGPPALVSTPSPALTASTFWKILLRCLNFPSASQGWEGSYKQLKMGRWVAGQAMGKVKSCLFSVHQFLKIEKQTQLSKSKKGWGGRWR